MFMMMLSMRVEMFVHPIITWLEIWSTTIDRNTTGIRRQMIMLHRFVYSHNNLRDSEKQQAISYAWVRQLNRSNNRWNVNSSDREKQQQLQLHWLHDESARHESRNCFHSAASLSLTFCFAWSKTHRHQTSIKRYDHGERERNIMPRSTSTGGFGRQ